MANESGQPVAVGSDDGLGLEPERGAFDLHDCATGYAYMEATDPDACDDWTTDDIVKAFIAGYEKAKRQERAVVAAERERCAEPLRRLGARLASLLDEDQWAECEALLLEAGVGPNDRAAATQAAATEEPKRDAAACRLGSRRARGCASPIRSAQL